ncbi:MAG: dihydrodipicolinate synthase family protein, partial [Planctomycetota bacterium]
MSPSSPSSPSKPSSDIGAPFRGVIPALVTPFAEDGSLCATGLGDLARRMLSAGCTGTVWPGSLGEGQTLSFEERTEGWRAIRAASEGRGNAFATISAASTREAVR